MLVYKDKSDVNLRNGGQGMNILPIGSVVRLNEGQVKLMILNRAPLHNNDGLIGYFDYSACVYPTGVTDQQAYFFNHEDIDEVYHEGYVDKEEKLFQEEYEGKIKEVPYPKFNVVDE